MKRNSEKHLKTPPAIRWAGFVLAVGVTYLGLTILEGELFNTHYTSWAYGFFLMSVSVYGALKMRTLPLAVLGILIGTAAWHYEMAVHLDTILTPATFNTHLVIMGIAIVLFTPLMILQKKRLEASTREIFELAARPVNESEDGFSARPFPAGKTDCRRPELIRFAHFLSKKNIARPLILEEGIRIPLNTGRTTASLSLTSVPEETSYVYFDNQGHITVFIHPEDYQEYKQRFTFDQLCQSMGDLFKKLLAQYQQGDESSFLNLLQNHRSLLLRHGSWILYITGFIVFVLALLIYLLRAG